MGSLVPPPLGLGRCRLITRVLLVGCYQCALYESAGVVSDVFFLRKIATLLIQ